MFKLPQKLLLVFFLLVFVFLAGASAKPRAEFLRDISGKGSAAPQNICQMTGSFVLGGNEAADRFSDIARIAGDKSDNV